MNFAANSRCRGGGVADVVIDGAKQILAKKRFRAKDIIATGMTLVVPFSCDVDMPNVEARVLGNSQFAATIVSLDFVPISADQAEVETVITDPNISALAPRVSGEFASTVGLSARGEGMDMLQLGRGQLPTLTGDIPLLRGVEAIRVRLRSAKQVDAISVSIDGVQVGSARNGHGVPAIRPKTVLEQYFNCWFDVSNLTPGLHALEVIAEAEGRDVSRLATVVQIERSVGRVAHETTRPDGEGEALEARVNRAPSAIHSAIRGLFDRTPKRILVVRVDQLGDFVVSVPAFARLRERFPDAEIIALVGPSTADLARSLNLFQDVLTANYVYDSRRRRRCLSIRDQDALREMLKSKRFDLAIDFCGVGETRELLRLAEARWTAGFKPFDFPWLDIGIDWATRDKVYRQEATPPSAALTLLVDAIYAACPREPLVIQASNPDTGALARFGLQPSRFALMHAGGRLGMVRWPLRKYVELTRMVLEQTDLKVLLLTDVDEEVSGLDLDGLPAERVTLFSGNLPFSQLDGLMSCCAVFIGNDSGPKHLAALRGAKVLSIHSGRTSWREWGQEGDGLIVARDVPCIGCTIEHAGQCGKEIACITHIEAGEVFRGFQMLVGAAGPTGGEKQLDP